MYKAETLILYGKTGVCRVEGTTSMTMHGEKTPRPYYVLRPLYQKGTILVPVEHVESGRLNTRPIMSRSQAQSFIKSLPGLRAEPYYNQSLSQLREHYRQQFGSCTGQELALLISSIYLKKREVERSRKKFSAVDQQFLDEAENLLFGELAASLNIGRDEVKSYIDKTLRRCEGRVTSGTK